MIHMTVGIGIVIVIPFLSLSLSLFLFLLMMTHIPIGDRLANNFVCKLCHVHDTAPPGFLLLLLGNGIAMLIFIT